MSEDLKNKNPQIIVIDDDQDQEDTNKKILKKKKHKKSKKNKKHTKRKKNKKHSKSHSPSPSPSRSFSNKPTKSSRPLRSRSRYSSSSSSSSSYYSYTHTRSRSRSRSLVPDEQTYSPPRIMPSHYQPPTDDFPEWNKSTESIWREKLVESSLWDDDLFEDPFPASFNDYDHSFHSESDFDRNTNNHTDYSNNDNKCFNRSSNSNGNSNSSSSNNASKGKFPSFEEFRDKSNTNQTPQPFTPAKRVSIEELYELDRKWQMFCDKYSNNNKGLDSVDLSKFSIKEIPFPFNSHNECIYSTLHFPLETFSLMEIRSMYKLQYLRWHPDKFNSLFSRLLNSSFISESSKQMIKESISLITQALSKFKDDIKSLYNSSKSEVP